MKDKESLIGYDPLAWMASESEVDSESPLDNSGTPEDITENTEAGVEEISQLEVNKDDDWFDGTELDDIAFSFNESTVEQDDSGTDLPDHDSLVAIESVSTTENEKLETPVNNHLILDKVLNIQSVDGLKVKLLAILQHHDVVDIDASNVMIIDTANLQVLIALKLMSIQENKTINFDFPSEKFIEAAKLLNLYELLALDETVAGFF